jgi:hypothetical protein
VRSAEGKIKYGPEAPLRENVNYSWRL